MRERTDNELIEEVLKETIRDIRESGLPLAETEEQLAIARRILKDSMDKLLTLYDTKLPIKVNPDSKYRLIEYSPTLIRGKHLIRGKWYDIAQALVEGKVRYFTNGIREYIP